MSNVEGNSDHHAADIARYGESLPGDDAQHQMI